MGWSQYHDLIFNLSQAERERLLIIPGNHDLTLTTSYLWLDGGESDAAHERRCRNFVEGCLVNAPRTWRLADGRTSVVDILKAAEEYRCVYDKNPPESEVVLVAPAASGSVEFRIPQELRDAAKSLITAFTWPSEKHLLYRDLLRIAYPMLLYEDEEFVVIGLNSAVPVGYSLWSSAFGLLGRHQVRKLKKMIPEYEGKRLIFLLHHHIGFPKKVWAHFKSSRPWIAAKFLQLRDARSLRRILKKREGTAVMLHGHKHIAYHARGDLGFVFSAPSVAFGDLLGEHNIAGFAYSIPTVGRIVMIGRLHL